ncbi:MAG: hypothetical protein JST04_08270 [Bdellovibrionales bacterium]|nr:hypothetical protein [Bdellovibrionales bacterium]
MGFRVSIGVVLALSLLSGCLGNGVVEKSSLSTAQIDMHCTTPDGISGRPGTIEEVVALVNALPKPTSLGCFLDALEKPLKITATSNQLNGQPAAGARSPRMFIINLGLILSVVPDGVGADRLEMSESAPYAQSTKAEIKFPVLTAISNSFPYASVLYGAGTTCKSCHANETALPNDATHSNAYASDKKYPDPTYAVSIASILVSEQNCNPSLEPTRCRILSAVVGPNRDAYQGSY